MYIYILLKANGRAKLAFYNTINNTLRNSAISPKKKFSILFKLMKNNKFSHIPPLIENNSTVYHIIKDAPIPTGGSLELIDGGSKVVLQTGDSVEAYASAANSVDIITSVVDTISA